MNRSKSVRRFHCLNNKVVSILVLLDESLEDFGGDKTNSLGVVSILVLLDESLEVYLAQREPRLPGVSILVLLDESLEAFMV